MLKILSIAYPMAAVGPDAVGGAEQVLSMLDANFVRHGNESIVVACNESFPAGRLVSTCYIPERINSDVRRWAWQQCRKAIERALDSHAIDLIHFHGLDFYEYLPQSARPILVTMHLPPSWYPQRIFELAQTRPKLFLNFVSHEQKASCSFGRDIPVVENGVEVPDAPAKAVSKSFVMSLGRICPEKNLHIAMAAARTAHTPLVLAGSVSGYEAHERYFAERIKPMLGRDCRFVGAVNKRWKRRLLSRARCLLIPGPARETSSLVAMESLACGTPVVAFPSGALANVVEHGHTGFFVESEAEMADAIDRCLNIDPEVCWQRAHERFSSKRMVGDYLRLYERILTGDWIKEAA